MGAFRPVAEMTTYGTASVNGLKSACSGKRRVRRNSYGSRWKGRTDPRRRREERPRGRRGEARSRGDAAGDRGADGRRQRGEADRLRQILGLTARGADGP